VHDSFIVRVSISFPQPKRHEDDGTIEVAEVCLVIGPFLFVTLLCAHVVLAVAREIDHVFCLIFLPSGN
jgi:hypothetical protein